jgi:cell division protease FtsH
LKKIKTAPGVEARTIARGTPGFSGADLRNIVNESALIAAKRNMKVVTMKELEEAKDKVMMGSERRSLKMSDEEKKLTAYHEGGHALVAFFQKASDPIHKATIIPRGRALGMVMRLPKADQFSETREKMKANMAIAMGGRVAEELIFGYDKVTSGASSDIQYATKIARAMVSEWGLSDVIGPLYHGTGQQDSYLGPQNNGARPRSSDTANAIDSEVKKLVEGAYHEAETILKEHIVKLHLLAESLLEYETLSGDDINDLLNGKAIRTGTDDHNQTRSRISSVPTSTKKKDAEEDIDEAGLEGSPA